MSDPMISPAPDDLAREWIDVATRARARYLRRVLVTSVLGTVMALGVAQFGAILWWAARTTTWWALFPIGLHASGIAIAIGWPVRPSLLTPVQGFRSHVARRFGDRVERLRALGTAILVESGALFAWPLVRFLVVGDVPRWGVTFTTAICSLAIVWPLQRIAQAQRAEIRRLQRVADRDAR